MPRFPTPGESGGGGQPGGSESGGGASGGDTSPTGSGSGGGDVGTVPPPPSQQGGGGGDSQGGDSGDGTEGDGDENPFADAEAEGGGDCGDTGVMPGGVGGMGQAGECIEAGGGGGGGGSDSAAAQSGSGGASGGSSSGAEGSGGAVGQFPEESAEERAERLGRELDESIGGFDETLQQEQQDIAAVGRVLEGFDIEGGDGGGDESGELISLGSQSGGDGEQTGGGAIGGAVQPTAAGLSEEDIQERTPADIPALADDDIIARQLREAALTEEDPVLRERLWNEYRKFKGLSVPE